MSAPDWHRRSAQQALDQLGVDARQGLSDAEAQRRYQAHGANRLDAAPPRSLAGLLADQFKDFMILVLIAAAVISGFVGELADTVAILVIVLLNAGVGLAQSWRADHAVHALKQLSTPVAKVRRDNRQHSIPAHQVVPGDIVVMEAGDQVPADLRLVETAEFYSDESILTGESLPVEKHAQAVDAASPLAERRNMAYKGTLAVSGRAHGLAVATGMGTELGRIAGLLAKQDDVKTPLQIKLAKLGRQLTAVVLLIAALVLAAGLMRGAALLPMLLIALSLAVAAIPEALPAVLTIAMSFGAARMATRQALVRRLPAVETLGSVTRICSDKTGTLTLNRMHVVETWPAKIGDADDALLLRAMALNGDVEAEGVDGPLRGEPTEVALAQAVGAALATTRQQWPRVAELPFDSQRKRMLTVHRRADGEGWLALLKGAPEAVLPRCDAAVSGAFDRVALEAEVERMAAQGGRVIAYAQRELQSLPDSLDALEQGLQFVGLANLLDPPRAEAAQAVASAQAAGIDTLMVTGDHPLTAAAIAAAVGIDTRAGVLTGPQIEALSDAQLRAATAEVRVYARVSPEQKIRIVQALRAAGEVVAVTGDGVNDAPALKAADIGVAMGRGGTDVARESADLVLLDDNFATIIAAIGEGRRIYDNMRKFVKYAITTNSAELLTLLLAPALGLPLPFLPIQILWINLVSDGLPGLALARDPADRDVMTRPPRRPGDGLFARGLGAHVIWMGLFMAGLILLIQAWALRHGVEHAQTVAFTAMTFVQMAQVLAVRAGWQSAFGAELLRNRYLIAAVLATVVAQLGVVYLPWAQALFSTRALSALELSVCVGAALLVFCASEIEKSLVRRGWLYAAAA